MLPVSQRTASSKVFCLQKEISNSVEWNLPFQPFCLTLQVIFSISLVYFNSSCLAHLSLICLQTIESDAQKDDFCHLKDDLGHLRSFRCLLENPCMPQAAPLSAAVSSQDCLHPYRDESSASISTCKSPETSGPKSSGHRSRSVSHHHSQSQRQVIYVQW